ncbi:MAG: hypothetical protein V3U38_03435 [Gemmatimonadota bacterium]
MDLVVAGGQTDALRVQGVINAEDNEVDALSAAKTLGSQELFVVHPGAD